MQNEGTHPGIFLFILILVSACQNNQQDPAPTGNAISPSHLHYESSFEVKSKEEKIARLNKALRSFEDQYDTLVSIVLDHKIFYHNSLKEYDSALYFSDSLVRVAGKQQDTSAMALGFYRKSKAQFYLDKHEEVFRNAFEARRLYLKVNDSSFAGRRSLEMANAQSRMGDHTGSRESATEALRYLDPEKDSFYLGSAYNLIGLGYRQQGFNEDAIPEYRNALKFSTNRADSVSYLNNIALAFQTMENYQEAIEILEDLIKEKANTSSHARYLDNLAYTKLLQEPHAKVEGDLIKAMELRRGAGDRDGLMASYDHLVKYYTGKNNVLAWKYAQKYLDVATDYGNSNGRQTALKHLLALAPATERVAYAEEYVRLSDSLGDAALKAQNTFAKIRFDEERKEEVILNLETRNTLQELQTRQMKTRLLISLLAAMLLIMGFSFLIYYLRQRHKKEKVREVHKTESRMAKVIHDELANDIFNVMSSLNAVVPEQVIDKLEKIYLRTRDLSRENSDIEIGENYLDYLKANLSNFSPPGSKLIISGENNVNWNKLGEEKKIVVYRVLQELMVNMNKHSGATLVAITFGVSSNKLNIQYFDNGSGICWKTEQKGSGLQNVDNRIKSLNGKINYESEEGKGFKVIVQFPI